MSKKSWLSICLMLFISASAWANLSESQQALYNNDRSTLFNDEEDELNDQGYIQDMEESEVQDLPGNPVGIKAKAQDCKKSGNSVDCTNVDIVN